MAKSNVPNYVQSALTQDRTQQVNTLSALVVYLFGEQKANREVKELGATLHQKAPHKSEKTWQNYVSAANAVVEKQPVKLEALWSAAATPADMVTPLVQWLDHELKGRKYQASMEDVSNWARGKPSMAAKAKADAAAVLEAQKAQAKADAEAAAKQKTQAEADKAVKDAEAVAAAALASDPAQKGDGAPMGDENGTAATGYAPAIGAPSADTAPVFALSAARTADGFTLTMADDLTRDDLQALIDTLQAHCDLMVPSVPTAPVVTSVLAFPVLEEVAPV